MAGNGTLETLAYELGQAFAALEDVLAPTNSQILFAELGLENPPDLSVDAIFSQKLAQAAQSAGALEPEIEAVIAASDAGDDAGLISAVAKLIASVVQLIDAIDVIATDLTRAGAGNSSITDLATTFTERVIGAAVVTYLEGSHPFLRRILSLLTIAESQNVTLLVDNIPIGVSRRLLHLDHITGLFKDPLAVVRDFYGWGTPTFDGTVLFGTLRDLLDSTVIVATADDADDDGPAGLELFHVLVRATTDATPPGLQATVFVDLPAAYTLKLAQLSDNWQLNLTIDGQLDAGVGLRLLPPADIQFQPPHGSVAGNVSVAIVGQQPDTTQPFIIFGQTGGSRLQALQVSIGVSAGLKWDIVNNAAKASGGFEAGVKQGKLVIDTSQSDSFLQKIIPADGLNLGFDFDLGWSSDRGVYFKGSASLELAFAVDLTLGPLHVDTVHLVIGIGNQGLGIEASVDGGGTLGPLSVSIERIGVQLTLKFSRGNLGPLDFGIGFKFPVGLGINIDAGPITGGGFIEFDQPNGRYAGVLALSLYSIQVKAIGLLDTKMPGGESGYSFLIIISVEFTPIQLGFGFTLNGVGGLCGINRDFITAAIQAGLRQHSLDHILFPKDPVANAPAIISDLRTIFPPAEGRYVFGPMLELGWGGGLNLVTAELGIILTVPSPVIIAILGQFNVNLPSPYAAIVELHLDVLGIIDFGKKLFSLDATLHDSRVVVFTIFGDMAMRLSWGANPSFALSVGGLNPHFQPPDGFPTLKRLTIALSASSEFKLSIQTYFAITSNSFQLGAKAELYLGVSAFNVYGWLGFDALFIFKPFSFVVDFTAGFALRSGTTVIIGISIAGELSGPKPWHATGEAHVTLLFFDIGVHVDITWGESQQVELPPTDAWPPLQQAIQNLQNWSGTVPNSLPSPVSVASPTADPTKIYVDPSGVLTLRERVLPLNQVLTKFGEAIPGPQNTFTVDQVQLGGQAVPFTLISDLFAPAQFEEMSDQDKLSRPSFDAGIAGFSVGDGQLALGRQLGVDVEYEDIYVDDDAPPPPSNPNKFRPLLAQQLQWARVNGAAKSTQHAAMLGKFSPAATATEWVQLTDETYVVASTLDLSQRNDITRPVSKGDAYRALAKHLAENPAESGQLQVLPVWELAA